MAVFRPWIGVVALYGFATLDPGWNWRWALDRAFPFQIYLAIFTLLGWTISGFAGHERLRRHKLGIMSLWGALAIAWISSFQALNADLAEFYLSKLWRIVLIATIAIALFDSDRKLSILVVCLVLSQTYNALQINIQYFVDGFSAFSRSGWLGGTRGDNNVYTIFTLPITALTVAICLSKHRLAIRLCAMGALALQLHQVMLLESRGGMLGALLIMVICAFLCKKSSDNIGVIILAAGSAIALAGPPVVREFGTIFASDDARDSSAESRFAVWKAGAEITLDHPFLGVGPWCGSLRVPDYYPGDLATDRKELHNLFFEVSTGIGLPGAILYFLFFCTSFFRCRACLTRKSEMSLWSLSCCLAVCGGIPGYMLASMFSSGALMESSYLLASIGHATVINLAYPSKLRTEQNSVTEPRNSVSVTLS